MQTIPLGGVFLANQSPLAALRTSSSFQACLAAARALDIPNDYNFLLAESKHLDLCLIKLLTSEGSTYLRDRRGKVARPARVFKEISRSSKVWLWQADLQKASTSSGRAAYIFRGIRDQYISRFFLLCCNCASTNESHITQA